MGFEKPLVAVKWLDAHGSGLNAYAEHELPHAAIEITTYGLLVREDAAGVSVAGEWCSDGTYRSCTFVPKGMLVSVTPLLKPKVVRSKKKKAPPPEGSEAIPSPQVT